jgi:hypothetical protein
LKTRNRGRKIESFAINIVKEASVVRVKDISKVEVSIVISKVEVSIVISEVEVGIVISTVIVLRVVRNV